MTITMTSLQLLKQAVHETERGHFTLSPEWLDQAVQVIDTEERRVHRRTWDGNGLTHDEQAKVWNWLIHWQAGHGNPKISTLHVNADRRTLTWQVGGRCYSEDLGTIFNSYSDHS